MQELETFCFLSEIRIRLKTSILLWCYFFCVFFTFLPNLFSIIFLRWVINIQSLLDQLFLVFLFFLPLNLDIFTREIHFGMSDYVIMNYKQFKRVFLTRIFANGLLMLLPIILGFLFVFLSVSVFLDLLYSVQFLIYLILCPFFFFSWFFFGFLILSLINLKYSDSLIRFPLFFSLLFFLFGFFFLIQEQLHSSSFILGKVGGQHPMILLVQDQIHLISMFLEIFVGHELFTNIFLTIILLFLLFFTAHSFLPYVLAYQLEIFTRDVFLSGLDHKLPTPLSNSKLYRFFNAIGLPKRPLWLKFIPFLGCLVYFILYPIFYSVYGPSWLIVPFLGVFGFHFFFVLLYVLLFVFPQITLEKQFNMEELLLSRLSVFRYFWGKFLFLLNHIFSPTLAALLIVIVLSRPSLFTINLLFLFVVIHSFYFLSLLLFLWRFFPIKSLFQSTFLSLLGIELVGVFISYFLFSAGKEVTYMFTTRFIPYNSLALFFSPLLSCLNLSEWIFRSRVSTEFTFYNSLWLSLILALIFFLASIVLLKTEVQFE